MRREALAAGLLLGCAVLAGGYYADAIRADQHRRAAMLAAKREDWPTMFRENAIAARLRPLDGKAWAQAGTALLMLRRNAEAERWIRAGLARQPHRAASWSDLAVALHRQGRHREARAAIAEARKLLPYDPQIASNARTITRASSRS